MSHYRIFFTNVRHLASIKGMNHSELAEKANISASLMSGITRGQGNPTLDTMSAIAQALGTPLTYLLEHHDLDKDNLAMLQTRPDESSRLPEGYEEVTVVLPRYRAFIAKQWNKEALKALKKKS